MFYKYWKESDTWTAGNQIGLPSGEMLDESNKQELDGWKWHDTPSIEYLEWKINEEASKIQ
jgi:hypothetical protein